MDWLNGLLSASFSVARCSRPTCGSAFWMTSPSSSSTRRSTPCAAGCCGPKFSVKFLISATAAGSLTDADGRILQLGVVAVVLADDARHERARLDGHGLIDDAALRSVVLHFDVPDQREILAERMADEAVIGEEATQIGMPVEQDPVQVKRLALVPVRGRPHIDDRVDHRRLALRREAAQA